MIRYDARGVTAQDRVIELLPNAHEFGFGSMVRVNGWWLYSAIYTTWDTLMLRDRTHLMFALTDDPMRAPYPYVWWDLPLPAGGVMSSFVWAGDRLLLFYGDGIYQVAIHEVGPYKVPAIMRVGTLPIFAWSDIALGDDNRLYALISQADGCWWWDCPVIREWASDDGGLTWASENRTWNFGLWYLGDACYVRDELGHIKRGALTVIALLTPNTDPASGTWRLHYFAWTTSELPASWGHEPGWTPPRLRWHLKREAQPRVFVEP
jgi:hypothetical protein